MIETEQLVTIDAGIDDVWAYARDIGRWASLMPGFRECEVIDDDTSRWTLKVGVGALLRTVTVGVHVDRWDGPGNVTFSYTLEGDPVDGDGTYRAVGTADGKTDIVLTVRVTGSGAMAPMWEAMGRPLLPKLAKSFAMELKAKIEESAVGAQDLAEQDELERPGKLGKLWQKIGLTPGQ